MTNETRTPSPADYDGIMQPSDPADFETPMQAVIRAIMEAEPIEGFPVAAVDEMAFRYGKDVALAVVCEALSSLGFATHATVDGELIDAQRAGEKIGRAKGRRFARKVSQRHAKHGARL